MDIIFSLEFGYFLFRCGLPKPIILVSKDEFPENVDFVLQFKSPKLINSVYQFSNSATLTVTDSEPRIGLVKAVVLLQALTQKMAD